MSGNEATLEPEFSKEDRDELGHIEYFLERLAELRDRGLIAEQAFDTAAAEGRSRREAIDRTARYAACIARSRNLTQTLPEQAIAWVERAIEIDRSRIDAWRQIVDLCWSLERDE